MQLIQRNYKLPADLVDEIGTEAAERTLSINQYVLEILLRRNAHTPKTPEYPDLRPEVERLTAELTAAQNQPAPAPDYPDLRKEVEELTAQLDQYRYATTPEVPQYPDLREQMQQLADENTKLLRQLNNTRAQLNQSPTAEALEAIEAEAEAATELAERYKALVLEYTYLSEDDLAELLDENSDN